MYIVNSNFTKITQNAGFLVSYMNMEILLLI